MKGDQVQKQKQLNSVTNFTLLIAKDDFESHKDTLDFQIFLTYVPSLKTFLTCKKSIIVGHNYSH